MKRISYFLLLFSLFFSASSALAVTDKEMEQARVIATQAYLRYANDGSGYLDELHPKTMADLEKALKAKEKENIKAFKQIPIPKDYAQWDKAKLVEFWAVKAFASSGLIEKGRLGKNRAKKQINAMAVAAPSSTTPSPAPQSQQPAQSVDKPEAQAPVQSATQPAPAPVVTDSTALNAANEEIAELTQAVEEEEAPIEKAENHTWVYILILCVLVAIVIALVVFASNVMKKNQATTGSGNPAPLRNSSDAENDEIFNLREKFAATLASKNNEIQSLNKKLAEVNSRNTILSQNVEALKDEVLMLRSKLGHLTNENAPQEQAQQAKTATIQPKPVPTQAASGNETRSPRTRSIFLGRANGKGIFVRADRALKPGSSIYRLDTNDGFTGTFRVANDLSVNDAVFAAPEEMLAGACVLPANLDTEGKSVIINDSAGTAIFEGGCWKVIRKAKIRFE